MRATRDTFSLLDLIGVFVSIMATLALAAFPFAVAPTWRSMLADFGGELPFVTELGLRPWFTPVLAAVPMVLLGVVWWSRNRFPMRVRRNLVVCAFIWSAAAGTCTWVAMHQPLLQMADVIGPTEISGGKIEDGKPVPPK